MEQGRCQLLTCLLSGRFVATPTPRGGKLPQRLARADHVATRNQAGDVGAFLVMKDTKLLLFTAILLTLAWVAMAADVTGKWVADVEGRNGNTQHMTFTLKADGANLTGTVLGGGGGRRGGGGGGNAGAPQANDISNGKIDGDKVSFEVKREYNGNSMVTKYEGTLSGDTLTLKETRNGRNGATSRDITAKRSTT